jgi:hypothetical protein
MRVQDVIRGKKLNLSVGDWGSGKGSKAKFPLSKAGKKAWSFGSAWEWRYAEFEFEGRQFVLRILVCEGKSKAHIHLGLRTSRDTIVICCYEYHADHVTGWHLHTLCGERNDIDTAPTGTLAHGPWVKRLPAARSAHRRTAFKRDVHGGLKAFLWAETVRFFRLGNEEIFQ